MNDVNGERASWFEPRKSLQYIREWLQKAECTIRIATGFFTIKGWNLVRRHTNDKQTYLLVGLDNPTQQEARQALIAEIMRDLRTGLEEDRREAARDLVEKIQSGQFQLVDARAKDHHNKLYISDEKAAVQTSSNLTGKGLIFQVEGGNVITDREEILALIREFDAYFADARDLTQELLDVLLAWLELATPWDIYLKTMLAFGNVEPPKTCYEKKPVSYQVDAIAQTLRHIRASDGSMLVASTGLGKTVAAVHVALHLRDEDLIDNVMVIGPKTVENNWDVEMRDAGLPCVFFGRKTFDKKTAKQDRKLDVFNNILEKIENQRWLVIIDESHEFRNQFKQDLFNLKANQTKQRAFIRLRELVRKGKPKVLLLTGSPYAKDTEDLNNQLYLLPHTAPQRLTEVSRFVAALPECEPLFTEETKDLKAWWVEDADDFIKLPVVSQLTTPHVAKYYGNHEDQNTYIFFDREKYYIPHVRLHSINFPLILGDEIAQALTRGYFNISSGPAISRDFVNQLVKVAWASSPLSLQNTLEKVIDTPDGENSYNLKKQEFAFTRQERTIYLQPIATKLKNFNFDDDEKLLALLTILNKAIENRQKAIIFSERQATVVYLYRELQRYFSNREPAPNIATTIEQSKEEEKYKMKNTKEVQNLIKQFAPIANKTKDRRVEYDIFIATDAQGVGVNMQDASVVINYDIAWTPIRPIQRAGRILRFWHSPRTIDIYTFVPMLEDCDPHNEIQYDLLNLQKRWNNLMSRHQESKKLIDLPVLTEANTQEIHLSDLASRATIQSGEMDINALADLEISPYYQHTAKLQANREYAETLPDDLISAKTHSEKNPLLYMLLFYQEEYRGIFYDPIADRITEPDDVVRVLNKIACTENTPTARVDDNLVEKLSDRCLQRWCDRDGIDPDEVQRICTLYLQPESESDNLEALLLETASKFR